MTLKEATAARHRAQQADTRQESRLVVSAKNNERRALEKYRRVLTRITKETP